MRPARRSGNGRSSEKTCKKEKSNSNNGLFRVVYSLGGLIEREIKEKDHLIVHFRPSLIDQIMHQTCGKKWAAFAKDKRWQRGLEERPVHIPTYMLTKAILEKILPGI